MTKKEALNKLVEATESEQKAIKDRNTYIFERATMDIYFYARLFVLLDLEEQGKRKSKKRDKKDVKLFDMVCDVISTIERHTQVDVDISKIKEHLESN